MGLRIATIADIEVMHRVRLAVHENRLRDASRVRLDDYPRMLETDGRGWLTTEPCTRAELFYSAAGWRRIRLEDNGEVRFERCSAAEGTVCPS
jgi:hypothetical protein